MPKLPQPDIDELIKVYQEAQEKLLKELIEISATGSTSAAQYKRKLLEAVNRELARLQGVTDKWVEDNMPIAYRRGLQIADEQIASQFKAAGVTPPVFPDEFAVINREAILSLTDGTRDTFDNLIQSTGRKANDNISAAVNEAIKEKIATGQTVTQAQKNVVQMLENVGLQSVEIIRAGKVTNMQLDAYASMVARSTTREATNQAVLRQTVEVGGDLVKMSSHAPTCPICWPLQGRVYSISGKTEGYPRLETAFSAGFANIHPNCSHVTLPYISELKSPAQIKKDEAFSNRPFEIEDMSPAAQKVFDNQIKVYNEGQKENREQYYNRKQWSSYLARLSGDAPQTFSGFMRIKNANSTSWRKLQTDYRSAGRDTGEE